jgi:hypothetical protein
VFSPELISEERSPSSSGASWRQEDPGLRLSCRAGLEAGREGLTEGKENSLVLGQEEA